MLKVVFFDLDGTLVQSEALKGLALARATDFFGGAADASLYKSVMGKSWETVTTAFLGHPSLNRSRIGQNALSQLDFSVDEFNAVFREKYLALLQTLLQPTAGADAFLAALKESGIKIGLITSAASWMTKTARSITRLQKYFDLVITGNDVQKHKPDPALYFLGLEKMKVAARDSITFEDSEAEFAAVRAAGIRFYGIRHDYNESHDFSGCVAEPSSFLGFAPTEFLKS